RPRPSGRAGPTVAGHAVPRPGSSVSPCTRNRSSRRTRACRPRALAASPRAARPHARAPPERARSAPRPWRSAGRGRGRARRTSRGGSPVAELRSEVLLGRLPDDERAERDVAGREPAVPEEDPLVVPLPAGHAPDDDVAELAVD